MKSRDYLRWLLCVRVQTTEKMLAPWIIFQTDDTVSFSVLFDKIKNG